MQMHLALWYWFLSSNGTERYLECFHVPTYQYAYETTETKRLRSPMINIWNWVRSFDHSKEYCAIFTVKAEIYGDSFVLNKSLFRFIG